MCRQLPKNCEYEFCGPQDSWRVTRRIRCVNCGNTRLTTLADPKCCRRICGNPGAPGRWKPRTRLGDVIAKGLARVGITKRRYTRALIYFRLIEPGRACGCGSRQEAINRFGDGMQRMASEIAKRLCDWWRKRDCRRCVNIRRNRNRRWLQQMFGATDRD